MLAIGKVVQDKLHEVWLVLAPRLPVVVMGEDYLSEARSLASDR